MERRRTSRGRPPRRDDTLAASAWAREVQQLIEADATAFLTEQQDKQRLALQRWARAGELVREIDALFQVTARAAHGLFLYQPAIFEDGGETVRLELRWRGTPPERSLIVVVQ